MEEDLIREITEQALEPAENTPEEASNNTVVASNPETQGVEELPPNTFGGDLYPMGTAQELMSTCLHLIIGRATIVSSNLADEENLVYNVIVSDEQGNHDYWVNSYWHERLMESSNMEEGTDTGSDHHEIPENSPTLTIDETTSRFSGAIWYEAIQKKTILVAGIGGIGSNLVFLLSRMKPSLMFLYDPDRVEAVNMSGQLYGRRDIGYYKVDSICDMVSNYADYNKIVAFQEPFSINSEPSDIMICGFDNMAARKTFYNKWLSNVRKKPREERGKCLLIDGRLSAEEFQVFAIQGNDMRAQFAYENKWLFADYEAEETVCSFKQTTFMANMIGSVMVNIFVNFVANECNPVVPRDVPFKTTYTADTMFFNVEM